MEELKNLFAQKPSSPASKHSQKMGSRIDLFNDLLASEKIDLKELEKHCFQGIPENNTIKAKCWKILLGYLPLERDRWEEHLKSQRNLYSFYINLLFQNPDNDPSNTNLHSQNNREKLKLNRASTNNINSRDRHLSVSYSRTPRVPKHASKKPGHKKHSKSGAPGAPVSGRKRKKGSSNNSNNNSNNTNKKKGKDKKNTTEDDNKQNNSNSNSNSNEQSTTSSEKGKESKHKRVFSQPTVAYDQARHQLSPKIDFTQGKVVMSPLSALFSDEEMDAPSNVKSKDGTYFQESTPTNSGTVNTNDLFNDSEDGGGGDGNLSTTSKSVKSKDYLFESDTEGDDTRQKDDKKERSSKEKQSSETKKDDDDVDETEEQDTTQTEEGSTDKNNDDKSKNAESAEVTKSIANETSETSETKKPGMLVYVTSDGDDPGGVAPDNSTTNNEKTSTNTNTNTSGNAQESSESNHVPFFDPKDMQLAELSEDNDMDYDNEGKMSRERGSIDENEKEKEKENKNKNNSGNDNQNNNATNTKTEEYVDVQFDSIGTAIDPLSDEPNNPWQTYFQDWDVWNRIEKDINRTHQTFAFFRSNHMIHKKSVSKKYRFPFDTSAFNDILGSNANTPSQSPQPPLPQLPLLATPDSVDSVDNTTAGSPTTPESTQSAAMILSTNENSKKNTAGNDNSDNKEDGTDTTQKTTEKIEKTEKNNEKNQKNEENVENQESKKTDKQRKDSKSNKDNNNNNNNSGYKVNGRRMSYNRDHIVSDLKIEDVDSDDDGNGNGNGNGKPGLTIAVSESNSKQKNLNSIETAVESDNETDNKNDNGGNNSEKQKKKKYGKHMQSASAAGADVSTLAPNGGSTSTSASASTRQASMKRNQKARIEKYIMDGKDLGIHAQIMIRILCVYARLNKGVEYVQGMNELLAPIYYVFAIDSSDDSIYAEADAFFCFMNLMSYLADRFIPEADHTQFGILACVNEYDNLLQRVDEELWEHLKSQQLDARFYALRWLMLLMAMEFELPEVLRLWDSFLSDENRFEFVTYFAVAMMENVRDDLLNGNFANNLQLLQKYPLTDLYDIFSPACDLKEDYSIVKDENLDENNNALIDLDDRKPRHKGRSSSRFRKNSRTVKKNNNNRQRSLTRKTNSQQKIYSKSPRFSVTRASSSRRVGLDKNKLSLGSDSSSNLLANLTGGSGGGGENNSDDINKRPSTASGVWHRVQKSWNSWKLFDDKETKDGKDDKDKDEKDTTDTKDTTDSKDEKEAKDDKDKEKDKDEDKDKDDDNNDNNSTKEDSKDMTKQTSESQSKSESVTVGNK